jgi:CRISPR-associated protein Cas2
MVEVNAGVFVGNPNRRVRDRLWEVLATRIGDGQAVLVEPATNEQGWAIRTAGRDRWTPTDFDGLILSARERRPAPTNRPR